MKEIKLNFLNNFCCLMLFFLLLNVSVHAKEEIPNSQNLPPHKKLKLMASEQTDAFSLNAVDTGREFLKIDQVSDSRTVMDKMKLHKLLYYAQGYHLAFYKKPLFQEEIYAYPHGAYAPNLTSLYTECEVDTKHNGSLALMKKPLEVQFNQTYSQEVPSDNSVRSTGLSVIKTVFEMKKNKTGLEMRADCHKEKPWKVCYERGEKTIMGKEILENYFCESSQVFNFLNFYIGVLLTENKVDEIIHVLKRTKAMIHSYKNQEDIISLSDEFNKFNVTFLEQHKNEMCEKMPELMMSSDGDMKKAIVGYLFFPHDFIEAHISHTILFSKLDVHYKLAVAALYEYPLSYIYLAKLLKYSDIFEDKILAYEQKALSIIENLPNIFHKGLCYFHLDMLDEAKACLRNDASIRHPFFAYLYGQILEGEDADAALEIYQSIQEQEPNASFNLALYQDSQEEQLRFFLKAAERGVLEGYVKIGELENYNEAAEEWIAKAANQGYMNALLSLGDRYKKNKQWEKALFIYQRIFDEGYLIGALKKGQMLENKAQYDDAKKAYQQSKWLGLHKLFEMRVSEEDEKMLNDIKTNKINHFDCLIKISEGISENDEDY